MEGIEGHVELFGRRRDTEMERNPSYAAVTAINNWCICCLVFAGHFANLGSGRHHIGKMDEAQTQGNTSNGDLSPHRISSYALKNQECINAQ